MASIQRFEEILAWKKAKELVREIYLICGDGKFSRDFGLKDQICRAAVSSMSNIAEGFGRKSGKDFAHFLDVSRGSALEVQSLLYVARDLKYINDFDFDRLYKLADETVSLIGGFTAYLRRSQRLTPNSKLRTPDN
jgi:four helix bundle protein